MSGKNGGARPGAGRKPKVDEIKIIEAMDAVMIPEDAWQKLAEKVEEGDVQAIKTWLAYRYGQPTQTVNTNLSGEVPVVWHEIKTYETQQETN